MKRPPADWSLRHGPIAGSYNAAAGLGALTAANQAFGLGISPWWAAGIAAAGALATHVDARARRLGKTTKLYRVCCWAAAGGWAFHALGAGPWDVNTLVAGGGLAMMAAILAPALAGHERVQADRAKEAAAEQERWDLAQQWAARIKRICSIRQEVTVAGIERWVHPDPAHPGAQRETGYTIEIVLPRGGYSWETLSRAKDRLGNDLDLPEGCSIDVGPGVSRRRALIDVTTVNVLAGDIPLAEPERLPATINDGITVGVYNSGAPVEIPLRWTSGVLVGAKRQGKSNMIKNVARQLLACDDVVVMGIDPNGGEVFMPFLRPWLEGRASRPAIDWVATSDEEAVLLLRFLVDAVPRRRSGYSDYMWANGGDDKLQVSSEIPQIVLLTDESKSFDRRVKDLMVQLNDRCGAASISMLTSWLRAVAHGKEGLPSDLLVQSETKISMRVNADAELKRLFGYSAKVPPAGEAPAPGWGHAVAYNGGVPRLYKGARSSNADAYADALRFDRHRPVLDGVTIGPDREVYERRWERALAAGWLGVDSLPGIAAPQQPGGGPPGQEERPARPWSSGEERRRRILDRKNRLRRMQGKPEVDADGNVGGDVDREFEAIVAGLQQQSAEVPRLLVRVLEAFGDDSRAHTAMLAAACGLDSRRLGELLRMVGVEPLPAPFSRGGRTGRGYKRGDVEGAVQRVCSGEQQVPDEVRDAL